MRRVVIGSLTEAVELNKGLIVSLNQTWVHLPMHNTMYQHQGVVKKRAVYVRYQTRSPGQPALKKPELPVGSSKHF